MSVAAWLMFGLVMLGLGLTLGTLVTGAGVYRAKQRLAARELELDTRVAALNRAAWDDDTGAGPLPVQHGTLAEHYRARHAAGIAAGTDAQRAAIETLAQRVMAGRSITDALQQVTPETEFAHWLASTGQPWGAPDELESA